METPFSNLLDGFHDMTEGWVDLIAGMELRLEKAYFDDTDDATVPRYIGTEIVRYAVDPAGALKRVGLELLTDTERGGEPSVLESIRRDQLELPHHRVFLQLIFRQTATVEPAILLSATSPEAIEHASTQLARTLDSVCSAVSIACTVFPGTTLAAPDIGIVVDGEGRMVPLTTRLSTVVRGANDFEVWRLHHGVPMPVELDPSDPQATGFFLLPGDEIRMR
jgi:hypothetical protein